jgi:ligand-binding sensor domain-containing protein/signal transduction histidine kinase
MYGKCIRAGKRFTSLAGNGAGAGAWLVGLGLLAAEELAPQYKVDAWGTESGLPQNSVKAIHQTSDGYLWFSTRFGIVRFDGVTFRVFDRVRTPGMTYDNGLGFAEDRTDKSLWVAIPQGVIRYKNQTFTTHRLRGSGADRVWSFCASQEGGVWLATLAGLMRVSATQTNLYTTKDGLWHNQVRSVLEEKDGLLWVGTDGGLQKLEPRIGTFTGIWRTPDRNTNYVTSLCKDGENALWFGTLESGLKRLKEGKLSSYSVRDGLTTQRVNAVVADSEKNIWVAQGDGKLLRFADGKFHRYGEKEGLSDDAVLCVYEDREANLWIGTAFGGLNRLQLRRIYGFAAKDGLLGDNVWSISPGRSGGLWIGTDRGLSHFLRGKFTNYRLGDAIGANGVKSVLEDREGNLWAGTHGFGIKRLRNGEVTHYAMREVTGHDTANALYQDKAGNLWVGATGGLLQMRDGVIIKRYTTSDGLSTNDVRGIREAPDGSLWLATYGGGLNRLREGRFTTFTSQDGLSDNFTWSLYFDADGVLWIGTEHGLTRLKGGKFTAFTTRHGLFDNVVNDVLEDALGNFWIGCNRGIYRVAKRELNDVAEGRAGKVEYVSYGTSDGMLSSETNGENQPAACKTRDGKLWFPTTEGVVVIDPNKTATNELRPPVVLEEVVIDHQQVSPFKDAQLPAGRGNVLEFRYTANSLVAPEKVLFQYWLAGCDSDWTDAGTRRVAYYTNLRPGAYTFRVRACNNHGVWNEAGAAFSFHLAPHFYQTYPFYVLFVIGAALAAYALHRLRLNVVRKIERLEKQHALQKERARIANEMHDDLGSSLTQIALLSELAKRDLSDLARAGDHIHRISSTTREVFRAMDEIVWAVNPKKDTVDSLVAYLCKYGQDFLRPTGIRCRLDVPASVPAHSLTAEERHNLFLAFKEALNNVVKHASASEVWVRITIEDSVCIVSVEDDGRGFHAESVHPDGNGLNSMRERLAAIGGRFELQSRPNEGTRLQLFVRLTSPKPRLSLN